MALIPSMMLFSFLSFLVILKSEANNDQLQFVYHYCNNKYGNITTETYSDNRNNLLSNMYYDKENDYGFYNSSYGQDPDKVYAIGFCRGDVNLDKCRSCLEKSAVLLRERCPGQKEGIGWFDECMLRYTNHSIFGVMVTQPNNILCNTKNATKDPRSATGFDQVVHNLLNKLRNRTTTVADPESDSSRSRKFFAEGNAPVQSSNVTIHALIQCTPDISSQNCTRCLEYAMTNISSYCDGKTGGRYLGPSCSVRYEIYPFFEPIVHHAPPPQPATQVTTTTGKEKSNPSRTIIAIVVPVVAVVVLLVAFTYNYLGARRRRQKPFQSEGGEGELDNDIKIDELLQFDFATIKFATNNFSDANKLGQGGFGIVYKGTLSDGQEIAIKRLSINSNQGETEFKNEILLTGKLQHRNLVRLLGFCFSRRERLLIYEFVPNKSLDYFIFDPNNRVNLNWERRYNIIRGIARGLLYLREDSRLQIVHRDLKTSNILLDEELNPKISDFGMARLFEINQTQASTNTIVGTFGYMAPEYIKYGQFSVKSDVFSFGVMILEIVCGQRNSEIRGSEENAQDLLSFEDIADRPTMNTVLLMLNSDSFPLAKPSEPAFLMRDKSSLPTAMLSGGQHSEVTRSGYSGSQSAQESSIMAPITEPYPR
ncbi:Cysteine-rich receptor-like protein kinase 26 isoform B [Glycine soja]|uniref:Cysteine-rich receptor-like protein kinase 26 isoform B n=1 Tax=Glycine soja TaxID=3848 RepID=A0A445F4U0_GLYSO|nr:Cysteine-rich receptor-like protein kinase 26 isoform B [Glycine soja]